MAVRAADILRVFLPASIRNRFRTMRDPRMDETLASYREQDWERNAYTSPSEQEQIDMGCAWGIELYTPSFTDGLVDSFRKLGWRPDDHSDPSRDPEAWLYGLRRHHYGDAWMNLGYLLPKATSLPFVGVDKHETPLPACARYATAGIYSISPSLVAVVVCFVFNDCTSSRFDKALRSNRQTYTTPLRRGHQIHGPVAQKTDSVRDIRVDVTRQIGKWFWENLPGLFSSGLLDYEIPTCELVTLREATPFPLQMGGNGDFIGYLGVLGMMRDFNAWKSSTTPGLKFRMADRTEGSLRYHSILAINERQHIDGMPDYWGSTERASRVSHIDQVASNLLSLWSILPMLEGFTQHLHDVRDLASFKRKSRIGPAKLLERLGGSVASNVDIASVTAELAMYCDQGFQLIHSDEHFDLCDDRYYNTEVSLRKHLERIISEQVKWLQGTDRSIRDHLTQYGSLIGAMENIRTQRTIIRLTWMLIVLTIATGLLAGWALFRTSS